MIRRNFGFEIRIVCVSLSKRNTWRFCFCYLFLGSIKKITFKWNWGNFFFFLLKKKIPMSLYLMRRYVHTWSKLSSSLAGQFRMYRDYLWWWYQVEHLILSAIDSASTQRKHSAIGIEFQSHLEHTALYLGRQLECRWDIQRHQEKFLHGRLRACDNCF